MESRRKINTFIKTKNTLESDLAKEKHRHLFEPWDVEQNDDFFFWFLNNHVSHESYDLLILIFWDKDALEESVLIFRIL